jgi:hypothetical protein
MGCGGYLPLDRRPGEARGDFSPLFPTGWKGLYSSPAPQSCGTSGMWPGLTQGPTAEGWSLGEQGGSTNAANAVLSSALRWRGMIQL